MDPTSIDALVAHCQSGRFTGILRMRAKEGIGEIWFLSGVADEVTFGTSKSDEALDRMRKATDATYELMARLPHAGGGFKRRFPTKGSIATATPVTLMRYCEQYALTCKLAVESKDVLVEATYEMGDLVSVETTADDDGITSMLEATDGTYEFTLPNVELPEGTPVLPPASTSIMESIPPPEPRDVRALLEIKPPVVGRPASDEAEVKRKTVEMARQKKASTTARAPVPRPASTPIAAPVIEEKKEEPKPVAAAPVEEPAKKPEPEPEPEPVKTPEPTVEAAPPKKEEKKEEEKPVKAPPPEATRSVTWLVVPILFAVALVYLLWTNRI